MIKLWYVLRFAVMATRIGFRFVSGRPLSGERKTNATFTRRATVSLDPSHTALRWEMLAGWQRAAWRAGGLYLATVALLSALTWPLAGFLPWYLHGQVWAGVHVFLVSVLLLRWGISRHVREHGWRLRLPVRETELDLQTEQERKRWRLRTVWETEGRRDWEREIVFPLGRAVAAQLQLPSTEHHLRELVHVPRDFRDGGPVEILLPATFTGADQRTGQRLVSTVRARLNLREDLYADWQLTGSAPRVLLRLPELPPEHVTFADMLPYLGRSGEWDFVYGIASGGEGFSVSISGDSPHGAISAGSGAGKSVLLRFKIAQAGHKGWNVIVLDWKAESQRWCHGLDGVRYYTSVEKIHDALVRIGEEVEQRKENPGDYPRVLVVCEEWNATSVLLAEYWSMLRSTADPVEKQLMPLRSPALTGYMKLVFAGRSLGLFNELIAQRFSARVTNGNADFRENFQVIHLARWKPQTVKMLAGDVKPFPRKPRELGRWVAVNGDQAVVYQAPMITDDEAREWFLSGREIAASPFGELSTGSEATMQSAYTTLQDPLPREVTRGNGPAIEAEVITGRKLSEMAEGLAPLGVTEKILRLAANEGPHRDPAFPAPIGGSPNRGYTYDYSAVRTWARNRFAARSSERTRT